MKSVAQHPSTERLAAFISGRVADDEEQLWIEKHLDECQRCAQAFGQLSRDDSLLLRIREHLEQDCDTEAHQSAAGKGDSASVSRDTEALSGTTLGKYEIAEIVGRGGMGVVYKARDSVILRDVAFKVLPTVISQDERMMGRLLTEARHAGSIASPHVVTIFDMATESGIGYVAMEFVSGGSAADLLKQRGPLSWEHATRYLLEACKGIRAAHGLGLIHRDIKPANLLLTHDGQVKVADFGLAQAAECDHTLTAAGTISGTAHFMSPEQCRGEDLDSRSDIYSLGATYFNLLTGKTPFSEMTQIPQIMFAHCHASVPDPSQTVSAIPNPCSAVVARCMAKSPGRRYQDCDELIEDLSSILDGSSSKSSGSLWRSLSAIPSGPSLIVLPFRNLSAAPEQEYFSDGITHEIITQLGRFRELHLIAGNTSFQYKGQAIDTRGLRSELDVQYALEGTVRQAGDRIRVSATLLDTETSSALWTDRFDKDLSTNDIFAIQDEIAERVTSALAQPHGQLQMVERTRRQASGDMDAYDAVLRFYEYWYESGIELYWQVRELLEEVVQANPAYPQASAALSLAYLDGFRVHGLPAEDAMQRAHDLAKHALATDPHSEMAHEALVSVYFHRGDRETFARAAERALTTHPNHADLVADLGLFFTCLGKYKRGMALAEKALALSPRPPGWYYAAGVINAINDEDYEDAARRAFAIEIPLFWAHVYRAVPLAHLNRLDEARHEMAKAVTLFPELCEQFRAVLSHFQVTDAMVQRFVEGAQKAGLDVS